MSSSTATEKGDGALSADDAIAGIERSRSRDEVLAALAKGLCSHLAEARLFAVQGKKLKGLVALDGGRIDTSKFKGSRLSLTPMTVGGRAVRDGVPYIGPLPPTDPFSKLFAQSLHGTPAVVAPISLGTRAVCLLVGHPEGPATAELRDEVLRLTDASAVALARVLSKKRQPGETDRVVEADTAGRGTEPAAEPKTKAPARATLRAVPEPEPAVAAQPNDESASQETASAQAESSSDRRSSVRLPHVVEVTHTSDHNFFVGFMEDISEGGLFVATYAELHIGEELVLQFRVPGLADNQTVHCRVRWARDFNPQTPDVIPGVGVNFLDLEEPAVEAIQRFIRQRAAIFYDD